MASASKVLTYLSPNIPDPAPGPLFIKRRDVLPQDLLKSRSRKIGCYNGRLAAPKFNRHFHQRCCRGAFQISERLERCKAEFPAASKPHEISGKTSVRLVNRGPAVLALFHENKIVRWTLFSYLQIINALALLIQKGDMLHYKFHRFGRHIYSQVTLQWRQNERGGVSNHQPHDCLLNRLFRHRSKKTSKFRISGLCAGNSPVTGELSAQRTSNAEKSFHLMTPSWHWATALCIILHQKNFPSY